MSLLPLRQLVGQASQKHSSNEADQNFQSSLNPSSINIDLMPSYSLISNNSTKQAWRDLIKFKCIITEQLPKMSKQYITRLLFDGRHYSLIQISQFGFITGGICFRHFGSKSFVELVFMTIGHRYKNKGLGSKLADQFKKQMRAKGIKTIVTYADNTAIGFFKKQGFEPTIQSAAKDWSGYIKQYLQGTLMQCKLQENLTKAAFKHNVSKNRAELTSKIQQLYKGRYSSYNGSEIFSVSRRQSCQDLTIEYFKDIPGVLDNNWSIEKQQNLRKKPQVSRLLVQLTFLAKLRQIPQSNLFRGIKVLPITQGYCVSKLLTIPILEKKVINFEKPYTHQQLSRLVAKMIKGYRTALSDTSLVYQEVISFENQVAPLLRQLMEGKIKLTTPRMFKTDQKPLTKSRKQ